MTAKAFASAGLFALVFAGLRRQDIVPPEPGPASGLRHAGRPFVAPDRKRALLAAVMSAHGPLPLLRVGEAIADLGFHPMLHALLRARGPVDVLGRWHRLERYAHSHHRTLAVRLDPAGATMRHVSLAGPPPSAAEDLLVLGVQLSLLRAVGCRDATAWAGAAHVALPDGSWDSAAIDAAVAAGDTATWHLSWSGWAPVCGPPFAVTAGAPIGTPAVTFDGCTEAAALAALLARDPARHLALAEAVSTLGLSPRTLQRRLAAHGLTATAVGRAVQVRHACALLAGGGDPLPAIGFACGFSDQAHFTREFRKRVNMTPGAYRLLTRGQPVSDARA